MNSDFELKVLELLKPVPYETIEFEFSEISGLEIDDECTDFRCGCSDYDDAHYYWIRDDKGEEYYFNQQEVEELK